MFVRAYLHSGEQMTGSLRRILFGLVVLLAVGGCKGNQRTELVVQVDSNLVVRAELDKVELTVTANGKTQYVPCSLISDCKLPWDVGVVEATAGTGSIEIIANGYLNGSAIVNETAVLSFVEGQSMLLKLFLAAECRDNPCAADTTKTCTTGGTCVPVTRTPSDLTPYTAGAAGETGGISGRGGASNGGLGGVGGSADAGVLADGGTPSVGGSGGSIGTGRDTGVVDVPVAQPDVPQGDMRGEAGGIDGAAGSGGTGGAMTSSGGVTGTDAPIAVGGVVGTGGAIGTGGLVGMGGTTEIGGSSSTGGATSAVPAVYTSTNGSCVSGSEYYPGRPGPHNHVDRERNHHRRRQHQVPDLGRFWRRIQRKGVAIPSGAQPERPGQGYSAPIRDRWRQLRHGTHSHGMPATTP